MKPNKVIRNILGDKVSRNSELQLFNSQVNEVNDFDSKVQERNLVQEERKLNDIYRRAKGSGYGWGGIAKQDPNKFLMALALARNNKWVFSK